MIFLKKHIYLLFLFLTITEGPITSFIGAEFAAQNILRIEYVFCIALLGDVIGDMILYTIGRFLYKISRINKRYHKIAKRNKFKNIYNKYPFFYFLIIKITPYLSAPGLISVGIKKRGILSFLKYSILTSIIVKTVYISIGYLGGISVKQLNAFLHGRKIAILYILIGILLFQCIKKFYQRIFKKIKKKID